MNDIRSCTICAAQLPHGPRPVLQVSEKAKVLIAGQAPGRRVHESGTPFDDPSGDRLRQWLGVSKDTFYDPEKIAIVPMGFCYPGTGNSGDLPPRPECAQTWHSNLLGLMTQIDLTIVIGRYAIDWHVPEAKRKSLTDTVKNWRQHGPDKLVLPHPSPRNNIWLKKNPWFEAELLPHLQETIGKTLNTKG